jgi:hypothetical protein
MMVVAEGTVMVSVQPIAEFVSTCVQASESCAVVESRTPVLSVKVPVKDVDMLPGGEPPGPGVAVLRAAVSRLKAYVSVPPPLLGAVKTMFTAIGAPGSGITSVGGVISVIVTPVPGSALPLPPALTVEPAVRNVFDDVALVMHPAVLVLPAGQPVLTLTPCPKLNVPVAGTA